jgi:hypothetical protein
MRIVTMIRRLGLMALAGLAAVLMLELAQPALAAPVAKARPAGVGFVRLAHLSPDTPAVDVYLYSFGDPSTHPILRHISYGNVSQFEQVTAGVYAVAMRRAGAAASTTPVVSATVRITAGHAYTVAALGPAKGLQLSVFTDPQTTPAGKALVQVIQASLRQNKVSVTAGGSQLATGLAFGTATGFVAVPAGNWSVRVAGPTQSASQRVQLGADTVHTLVVLDGRHGLMLDNLMDAAGSTVLPKSGVQTGFGGTAARPGAPLVPWVSVGLAGLALVAFGSVLASRRHRYAQ